MSAVSSHSKCTHLWETAHLYLTENLHSVWYCPVLSCISHLFDSECAFTLDSTAMSSLCSNFSEHIDGLEQIRPPHVGLPIASAQPILINMLPNLQVTRREELTIPASALAEATLPCRHYPGVCVDWVVAQNRSVQPGSNKTRTRIDSSGFIWLLVLACPQILFMLIPQFYSYVRSSLFRLFHVDCNLFIQIWFVTLLHYVN
jgi:hypothetical protein